MEKLFEKLFEKLSDEELERRIGRMGELMITGGDNNDPKVAYGALDTHRWLTGEQEERKRKKDKAEGKPLYKPIFCFELPNYG